MIITGLYKQNNIICGDQLIAGLQGERENAAFFHARL